MNDNDWSDFMEELHQNYREESPKELLDRLLDDWMFLKSEETCHD